MVQNSSAVFIAVFIAVFHPKLTLVFQNLYFLIKTNLEEVTTLQQQQVLLIVDELNQLERYSKENLARLSVLATGLLNQFKSIQIQKWDPGKYSFRITLLNLGAVKIHPPTN